MFIFILKEICEPFTCQHQKGQNFQISQSQVVIHLIFEGGLNFRCSLGEKSDSFMMLQVRDPVSWSSPNYWLLLNVGRSHVSRIPPEVKWTLAWPNQTFSGTCIEVTRCPFPLFLIASTFVMCRGCLTKAKKFFVVVNLFKRAVYIDNLTGWKNPRIWWLQHVTSCCTWTMSQLYELK